MCGAGRERGAEQRDPSAATVSTTLDSPASELRACERVWDESGRECDESGRQWMGVPRWLKQSWALRTRRGPLNGPPARGAAFRSEASELADGEWAKCPSQHPFLVCIGGLSPSPSSFVTSPDPRLHDFPVEVTCQGVRVQA